ncbi:MAG: hypothetical protein JXR44_03100 [Thiotrichales bacterium]|nr:hypothetical protein [Thiotrichales bacterium]
MSQFNLPLVHSASSPATAIIGRLVLMLFSLSFLSGCVVQHRTVVQSPPQTYPAHNPYYDRQAPHHRADRRDDDREYDRRNAYEQRDGRYPHRDKDYRFGDNERKSIYQYYHPKKPYKAGKPFPPGHDKRPYHLHKPLPKHVKYSRLPTHLEQRLGPPPRDLLRVRVGGDILLIHHSTRVIYDILFDF